MKNRLLAFPLLFVIMTISSCNKNETLAPNSWAATINGQTQSGLATITYSASAHTLYVTLSPSATNLLPRIYISTAKNTTDVTTGTYQLDGSDIYSIGTYFTGSDNYKSTQGGHGQLNIAQIDLGAKTITGSFDFVAYNSSGGIDSVMIATGSFNGTIN